MAQNNSMVSFQQLHSFIIREYIYAFVFYGLTFVYLKEDMHIQRWELKETTIL